MARGGMPMRPTGGGRPAQTPRRTQPKTQPKTQPARQQKPPAKGGTSAQQRQQTAQQRLVVQQHQAAQRQAAIRANQQRVRQQIFLRQAHSERQEGVAVRRTEEVRQQVASLESILRDGLQRSARIDLDALRHRIDLPRFDPGPLGDPAPAPLWEDFAPGALTGRFGSQSWKQRQEANAREAFERARAGWEAGEQERRDRLDATRRAHEERLSGQREQVERYHARIARVRAGLQDREPAVVESFLRTVLRRVPLPDSFPRRAEVTHHPADEHAVVRMVLPDRTVVPQISGYEYAAGPDEIRALPRSDGDSTVLYLRVIAQVALLVMRDVFDADPALGQITFQGLAAVGDPPEPVSLLVVETDRDPFAQLDLEYDAPEDCLSQLGARVSADPFSYQPVPGTA